jgi:DNA-binding Lrp family transcriptional regulator
MRKTISKNQAESSKERSASVETKDPPSSSTKQQVEYASSPDSSGGKSGGPTVSQRPIMSKRFDEDFAIGLLDKTNKQIIDLLERDAFASQIEIAKQLGLSQSSIALRLDRLRRSGILTDTAGIHLKMIGLEMSRTDVNCSNSRAVLEWAKSCPLFINGTIGVGGTNISLYFTAEDIEMFQYIIDEHIRKLDGVSAIHFSPIVNWAKDYIAPVPMDIQRSTEPPCKMLPYCPRCPANPDYNGTVWNSNGKK